MNKKGFTLVELLVTITISTLVLSLGTILVNEMIEKNEKKAITIAQENIKKSANLYSKEFLDEIVWLNNQSCISIEQLISKGYISKEKADYADLKYVIIEKDDNNTIVEELTEEDFKTEEEQETIENICEAIIHQKVSIPTSKNICKENLEYDGKIQQLTKDNIDSIYQIINEFSSTSDAGNHIISVNLQNGYHWADNSVETKKDDITGEEKKVPATKKVYCTIQKGIPDLKLKNDKNEEIYIQDAEQTIPIEVTIESNVSGTIELKSSNNKYATVEFSQNNEQPNSNELENKEDKYIKNIIIKNNGNRETNTYITIKLIPIDDNYQTRSTTYVIGNITDIKVTKPTEDTHCIETYFNNKPHTITKPEEIGYTIPDTQFTEANIYDITASLHPGFEWEDGSTDDIVLECEIQNPTYFVHYAGNGNTGQKYNDKEECNDNNKCGLERYTKDSQYNTTKKIFEHTREYIYNESYNLVKNQFTKKGYSFAGWSKTTAGDIKFNQQQRVSVSELINVETDTHKTIVTLYAQWEPKTYTVTYNGNGGNSTEYGTTWSETATYDTNYKTRSNWYDKKGYTFAGWNEKADGSGVDWTDYINKDWKWTYTKNITLYAQWRINKVYIQYSTNGGDITKSTTENGTTYTWIKNSNGIISRATSSGAATQNFAAYNYGGSTSTSGLADWNNTNYINISKTGYGAKSGEQWICLSGACQKNKTYDHNKVYAASDFCDASSGNCTAVLGVNWVDNVKPTCTISKRTTNWDHYGVDITINCSDAGSGCTEVSKKVDNLKESKTYPVTDNAGNSGSCNVSISDRKMWHKRSREKQCVKSATYWGGTCAILSPSNLRGTKNISGAASEEQCIDWCDDETPGAFSIDCDDYSVCTKEEWVEVGSWSGYIYDYNCSNGTSIICKYRTEYK